MRRESQAKQAQNCYQPQYTNHKMFLVLTDWTEMGLA